MDFSFGLWGGKNGRQGNPPVCTPSYGGEVFDAFWLIFEAFCCTLHGFLWFLHVLFFVVSDGFCMFSFLMFFGWFLRAFVCCYTFLTVFFWLTLNGFCWILLFLPSF